MTEIPCPIWQTPAKDLLTPRGGQEVESPRAGGRYVVTGSASAMLETWDELKKIKLTSWLVEERRLGDTCPAISSSTLDEVAKRRPPSVHDRADALLRYLDAKSDLLGTFIKFYALDNANSPVIENELLAWTASRKISEVIALAEYCSEESWILRHVTERAGGSHNTVHELMLRPPGFARLAELDGTNSGSKQAFVAMWFDRSMDEVYRNGIQPAIDDAGYEAVRVDHKDFYNRIDDEIIAEIRRSRFVIADFTQGIPGARGGVYYEAGFAHGLNIPVIFTCCSDSIDKVHFDTRQYNHISWGNSAELRERLAKRISATLGDGPLKRAL